MFYRLIFRDVEMENQEFCDLVPMAISSFVWQGSVIGPLGDVQDDRRCRWSWRRWWRLWEESYYSTGNAKIAYSAPPDLVTPKIELVIGLSKGWVFSDVRLRVSASQVEAGPCWNMRSDVLRFSHCSSRGFFSCWELRIPVLRVSPALTSVL